MYDITSTQQEREPRQVQTPREYMDAYLAGETVIVPEEVGLVGRFLRLRNGKPEDVNRLALDDRKHAFVMGADLLTAIAGRPIDDALSMIGWTSEYIADLRQAHYKLALVVFEGEQAPLATWENILPMIAATYHELKQDIHLHQATLVESPFRDYGLDAVRVEAAEVAGPSDPNYMTLQQYLNFPEDERSRSPALLRHLLVHLEHLGPTFGGQGYTEPANFREYFTPNVTISDLRAFAVGNVNF